MCTKKRESRAILSLQRLKKENISEEIKDMRICSVTRLLLYHVHNNCVQALSKTLETLNIGQNTLTDEVLSIVHESLKNNRVLLQLGMQSTELTCDGIVTLAEIMETNQVLQVRSRARALLFSTQPTVPACSINLSMSFARRG